MKSLFKEVKMDRIISAIFLLVVGIIMIAAPNAASNVIAIILAIALYTVAVFGIIGVIYGGILVGAYSLVASIGCIVIATWLLITPDTFATILDVVLAILIIVEGADILQRAFEMIQWKMKYWWAALIIAVAVITLGIVALFVRGSAMYYVGISLIISSISSFVSIISLDRKIAKAKKTIINPDDVITVHDNEE